MPTRMTNPLERPGLRADEVNTPAQNGDMANSERQAVIADLIGEVFVQILGVEAAGRYPMAEALAHTGAFQC